jgi:DNA-binding PadR family transcriptional regulator
MTDENDQNDDGVTMFALTGLQRDLLYVVAGETRPSGQEIKATISEDRDDVTQGRLYPNLDTLVDSGLVEKGKQNKRTNYYRITDLGVQVIIERREWEDRHLPVDL